VSEGASGSVEIEGSDGSWLILDLNGGSIHGVEVAVWPEVRKRTTLAPPSDVTDGRVMVGGSDNGIEAIEMNTALAAEADDSEQTIHFRLGPSRQTKTVRIARDILIDVDGRIASRAFGSSPFLHFRKASDHHHRSSRPTRSESGSGDEACRHRRRAGGLLVSGEWDLVAIVKVPEYEQIAQVVTERFPEVSAIERTQTLTAFRAYSKKDLEQAWDIGVE
jgi:hypothetical protein